MWRNLDSVGLNCQQVSDGIGTRPQQKEIPYITEEACRLDSSGKRDGFFPPKYCQMIFPRAMATFTQMYQ